MIFKYVGVSLTHKLTYDPYEDYWPENESTRYGCMSLVLPDKHAFSAMISNVRRAITLPVGISIRNPKDNNCKKIAREVSVANTVPCEFIVKSLDFKDGYTIFGLEGTLYHSKGEIKTKLRVKMSENKDKLVLL